MFMVAAAASAQDFTPQFQPEYVWTRMLHIEDDSELFCGWILRTRQNFAKLQNLFQILSSDWDFVLLGGIESG